MMKNVISAVCVSCGAEHEADPRVTTCKKCGGILDIKYDYDYIIENTTLEDLDKKAKKFINDITNIKNKSCCICKNFKKRKRS